MEYVPKVKLFSRTGQPGSLLANGEDQVRGVGGNAMFGMTEAVGRRPAVGSWFFHMLTVWSQGKMFNPQFPHLYKEGNDRSQRMVVCLEHMNV